jgi:hypothetical protein
MITDDPTDKQRMTKTKLQYTGAVSMVHFIPKFSELD